MISFEYDYVYLIKCLWTSCISHGRDLMETSVCSVSSLHIHCTLSSKQRANKDNLSRTALHPPERETVSWCVLVTWALVCAWAEHAQRTAHHLVYILTCNNSIYKWMFFSDFFSPQYIKINRRIRDIHSY